MKTGIEIKVGSRVSVAGKQFEIDHILDLKSVVGLSEESGDRQVLRVADIQAVVDPRIDGWASMSLKALPPHIQECAAKRYQVIRDLLNPEMRTVAEVARVAAEQNVHPTTIYRWLKRFEGTQTVLSLAPLPRSGGADKPRVSAEVEAVIGEMIEAYYLTPQRRRPSAIIERVRMTCARRGLQPPHGNTIRKRINQIRPRVRSKRRNDRAELERSMATPGRFPETTHPLQVVMIDHTPLDLIVVDDVYRQPIGRPWITVAIDIYSRVVTGFLVTLEAPSALSVGLVIAQSVMPKEQWLAAKELNLDWPVWGIPDVMHADNGADFRCSAVTTGCQHHMIEMNWRPVKKPQYGAHIERLLGTVAVELRNLRGATFGDRRERRGYNSDAEAVFTLREVEQLVAELLLGKYHNRKHSTLGRTPLQQLEEGLLSPTGDRFASGLPDKPSDPRKLQIDFLPYAERTVQRTGIEIEGIRYYGSILQKWIGVNNPQTRRSRKFEVRFDPRDMSTVYFWDPEEKEYFDIKVANLGVRPASLWEVRAAKKELRKSGRQVSEEAVFRAIEAMDRISEKAAASTKQVRRNNQRKVAYRDPTSMPIQPKLTPAPTAHELSVDLGERRSDVDITPFEVDIDDWG